MPPTRQFSLGRLLGIVSLSAVVLAAWPMHLTLLGHCYFATWMLQLVALCFLSFRHGACEDYLARDWRTMVMVCSVPSAFVFLAELLIARFQISSYFASVSFSVFMLLLPFLTLACLIMLPSELIRRPSATKIAIVLLVLAGYAFALLFPIVHWYANL